MILYHAQRIAEALEMHDFACTQELDRFAYIRVIDQAQQIVIRRARLLLCCNPASTNNAKTRTTSTLFL